MPSNVQGFPLSPQQKRMWSWRGDAESDVRFTVFIDGPVDVGRLYAALTSLTARHEILRTTFFSSAGMKLPFQVVNDSPSLRWSLETRQSGKTVVSFIVPPLCTDFAANINL